MKLIIVFNNSDGYTWQCTETIPIEAESEEQLIVDMEEWANLDSNAGKSWLCTDISQADILGKSEFGQVTIYTLEQWFEDNKVNK